MRGSFTFFGWRRKNNNLFRIQWETKWCFWAKQYLLQKSKVCNLWLMHCNHLKSQMMFCNLSDQEVESVSALVECKTDSELQRHYVSLGYWTQNTSASDFAFWKQYSGHGTWLGLDKGLETGYTVRLPGSQSRFTICVRPPKLSQLLCKLQLNMWTRSVYMKGTLQVVPSHKSESPRSIQAHLQAVHQ